MAELDKKGIRLCDEEPDYEDPDLAGENARGSRSDGDDDSGVDDEDDQAFSQSESMRLAQNASARTAKALPPVPATGRAPSVPVDGSAVVGPTVTMRSRGSAALLPGPCAIRGSPVASAASTGPTSTAHRQRRPMAKPSVTEAAQLAAAGEKERAPRYSLFLAGLAVLLVSAAAVCYMVLFRAQTVAEAPKRLPLVYAMATRLPTTPCSRVSEEDVLNGTALDGYISLRDMKATLEQHIHEGGLRGMCAQYLSVNKICMCIVDMSRDGDRPDFQIMYNVDIMGVSREKHVRNTEKSVLCADPVEVIRFAEIGVEYLSDDGVVRERWVKGSAAQTIQQLNIVERGRGSCEDSNAEAQLKILADIVSDIRTRLSYIQHPDQMPNAGAWDGRDRRARIGWAVPVGGGRPLQIGGGSDDDTNY